MTEVPGKNATPHRLPQRPTGDFLEEGRDDRLTGDR